MAILTLLGELNWKRLLHPPCSPDFAPPDYHLFKVLHNNMDGLKLTSRDELVSYFT